MAARSPVGSPAAVPRWTPGSETLRHFLAWLDQGTDSGGERYVEMRRRLVAYFSRKLCPTADDLADETLTRVMRRLEEEGAIVDAPPARYCYIVARFVFLEYLRSPEHRRVDTLEDVAAPAETRPNVEEQQLSCLERCLQALSEHDRSLVLGYYSGEEHQRIQTRQTLAGRLGLTPNALSVKACRLRGKLEACVESCVARRHEKPLSISSK